MQQTATLLQLRTPFFDCFIKIKESAAEMFTREENERITKFRRLPPHPLDRN